MGDLYVRFTDADGIQWRVWEEFGLASHGEVVSERGSGRGRQQGVRHVRDAASPAGHLVFESAQGLRRLRDAPQHWWDLPPHHLALLCQEAEPAE